MQKGRKEIFTDEPIITSENIIPILQKAMPYFMQVASDCDYLINFEKGMQEKTRIKKYRSDIDCWCVDNIANEITQFKVGFNWGNPITLIQRGEKDSGTDSESQAVTLLNEYYDAEEIKKKTQKLARFVEICGIGYTIVGINSEWQDGDSPFTVNVLDPRYAFIVKSSYYIDHRPMIGVTFRKDDKGDYHFTCFTKDRRYEIINLAKIVEDKPVKEAERDWKDKDRWKDGYGNGFKNTIGRIPIIEWIRDYDRMGCFERQISEMNNLNLLVSDFTNDVDQNTQAIFHANDIEFPKDKDGNEQHPKTNDWVMTQTTQDGKTPFINPLAVAYDYQGMLNNIVARRALILQKCNVPQRNDNSGGSTGIAMSDATGWSNAEVEANRQDQIVYGCKIEEVKCVLAAINETALAKVDDSLLKLRYIDVMPSRRRQKNYEMSVKTSALANMLSHGIYGLHALNTVNLFEDVNQVWNDSKELIEKYQSSLFEKEKNEEKEPQTTDGGYEAQISNSPRIDGMSKENPTEAEA